MAFIFGVVGRELRLCDMLKLVGSDRILPAAPGLPSFASCLFWFCFASALQLQGGEGILAASCMQRIGEYMPSATLVTSSPPMIIAPIGFQPSSPASASEPLPAVSSPKFSNEQAGSLA